jgi:hypothetical protein
MLQRRLPEPGATMMAEPVRCNNAGPGTSSQRLANEFLIGQFGPLAASRGMRTTLTARTFCNAEGMSGVHGASALDGWTEGTMQLCIEIKFRPS